jgi:hypothetical protein
MAIYMLKKAGLDADDIKSILANSAPHNNVIPAEVGVFNVREAELSPILEKLWAGSLDQPF